jgi:hypothetical protein
MGGVSPVLYTIYFAVKEFKVGGGRLGELDFEIEDAIAIVDDHTRNNSVTEYFYSAVAPVVELIVHVPHEFYSVSLPSVTLPKRFNIHIVKAEAQLIFRELQNMLAAENKILMTSSINVNKQGVEDDCAAIDIYADTFKLAASQTAGASRLIGAGDIVGCVDSFDATYEFNWISAYATTGVIKINDVQMVLAVTYY